jgi:hypothetical protein
LRILFERVLIHNRVVNDSLDEGDTTSPQRVRRSVSRPAASPEGGRFEMTFPYYTIPPETFERLPELFREEGFEVSLKPHANLPRDLAPLERTLESETERTLVLGAQGHVIELSAYWDTTLGTHVAHVFPVRSGDPAIQRLKEIADQVLKEHGGVPS